MSLIEIMKNKVINGTLINKAEATQLINTPLNELTQAADEIRKYYCNNQFDMCTIINGKYGECSEDCKYCAQSNHYTTNCKEQYPLLSTSKLLEQAVHDDKKGVLRYSIVTSGKNLSDEELDKVCESIKLIKEKTGLEICISFGLLNEEQFKKIKNVGVSRIHCNLETSQKYFSNVCTTHSYTDKINTINAAKKVGLNVCSGCIVGLGETMEDRIELAFTERKLGVKSIPINLLNPIVGTPYENNKILSNDELCRIIAIFRFILPDSFIRLAGGRILLEDKGKHCFECGANAVISGDMLTTEGISIEKDLKLLKKLGYEVKL